MKKTKLSIGVIISGILTILFSSLIARVLIYLSMGHTDLLRLRRINESSYYTMSRSYTIRLETLGIALIIIGVIYIFFFNKD